MCSALIRPVPTFLLLDEILCQWEGWDCKLRGWVCRFEGWVWQRNGFWLDGSSPGEGWIRPSSESKWRVEDNWKW